MSTPSRGPLGAMPTKEVVLKKGRVTDPDWHDCILTIDQPKAPDAVVTVSGRTSLHNVALRTRMVFETDTCEMANVWAGSAAGLTGGYAVPILAVDPDMQQQNNHKALAFAGGRVTISRLYVQNNDDVVQLGKRVDISIRDSKLVLQLPYLGDHRDTIDADDVARLYLMNTLVQGSGNSALFAKQETPDVELTLLHAEQCRFVNQWIDQPDKRQEHMVWLGYGVRKVVLFDNEWDARVLNPLLITRDTDLTADGNVYFNAAPAVGKLAARRAGTPLEITYFAGR